ncbi:MAG: radical SAM protein, partial [Proteobacteria bacterium]|nr:radical SAM protein [Pseudomonadota bacterium]
GNKYPELPNRGVLNTQDAIRLLEVMRTRASALYFAGGEPTMRKDLPLLTRVARDLDYYPIIINTNASILDRLLAKEKWRSWLADMDNIIVSLDSLDLEKLKSMWVYKKPENVIRNLLLLREFSEEMRFKLMVNMVIQPDTIDAASDVVDFVNDLGIWLAPVPMNTGATIDASLVQNRAYIQLANKIIARKQAGYPIVGSVRMNKRLLFSEKLTCRNALKPHVDYDGRLIWPCKSTKNVKPQGINVLDFDNVDDLYDYACTQISPTGFHGPAKNQCGGNCNWAQNYSTDTYAHGLSHPWSIARDILEFGFKR